MLRDDSDDGSNTTSTRRGLLAAAGAAGVGALAVGAPGVLGQEDGNGDGDGNGNGNGEAVAARFGVRIENVSDGQTLETTADGEASTQPVPLSPGVYAVHTPDEPVFSSGDPERSNGLEEVAEDGSPGRLVESLTGRETVVRTGAFTTPVGAGGPGPLTPGNAYEFEVLARRPATYLSLVTMFVPSNDLFYAFGGADGARLFEDGDPVSGDVTDRVGLWDAGTEINEEPGVGSNQVQRQRGAGVGSVERGTVAPIDEVNGYDYPATADVIRVTVSPDLVFRDGSGMDGDGMGGVGGN